MPTVSISIRGIEEVKRVLGNLETKRVLGQALLEIAAQMVEAIQEAVNLAYPPASVPGEPPHTRTGALKRSVRIEPALTSLDDGRVVVAVGGQGTGVPYAAYLEFGTSKMEPRPFVEPIAAVFAQTAGRSMQAAVDDAIADALR